MPNQARTTSNRNNAGMDICVSDTDMSEHGTVRSMRSNRHHRSNNINKQQHQHQQQREHGNRVQSSKRSKTSQQQQHNQSSRSVNFQQQRDKERNEGENGENQVDDEEDERIQVQVIQQDDNWGENTTAYTAATSEFSDYNDDNMTEDGRSHKDFYNNQIDSNDINKVSFNIKQYLTRYIGYFITIFICFITYITPIIFIILPRIKLAYTQSSASSLLVQNNPYLSSASSTIEQQQWLVNDCGIECEGLLIGISFKLFLLLIGIWALYFRKPRYTLPRINELRSLILILLLILTFSYWLFYGVRIIDTQLNDYFKILQFTSSYVDVLLIIFMIGIFILELRDKKAEFVVRLVRSPDGKQFEYTIGNMSIQRAAIYLLEQYYKDFPVYNPWLENAYKKRLSHNIDKKSLKNETTSLKYYNIDNVTTTNEIINEENNKIIESKLKSSRNKAGGGGGVSGSKSMQTTTTDRFYEEYDYERRLRKRRARLITATEEAFTHIKRIQQLDECTTTIMDPLEASQAIFMSIARELRRYLRITRQQPYFTRDSIVKHLADCISYDMSPKAFLQRYLNNDNNNSVIFNQRALLASNQQQQFISKINYSSTKLKTPDQTWLLICDNVLYQNIEDNLMLVLKQNEVTIMCTFKRLPYFNLIEDVLDPKRNKFVLKMNSETSV